MLGVCYYPEHWPKHYWADDAAKMKALGLEYVRVGEFCWSRVEPSPGDYDFAWLDEAIDILIGAGLKVIIGTPTATPPKWLIDQHPEILACDPETQLTRGFGSRRHYDFSSQVFLEASLTITKKFAERYGNKSGVVGWQTDNELCCHDTTVSASPIALAAFRQWCEKRYTNISQLNESWGNVFWSMEYRSFDEIELPFGAVTETNPSHRLAYSRFSSDQVIHYHNTMIAAIRELSPNTFVTHNFIPMSDTHVDNFALAKELDFTCYDNYPLGRTDMFFAGMPSAEFERYARTGHPDYASFFHDQIRGMSRGDYWIMEQQPGPVNWAPHNPMPAPGMVRFWTLEAFAHGASCVCYFRWRQAPFAQEQMHAGLLRRDNVPSDAWPQVQQVHQEISDLGLDKLPRAKSRVAILISAEGQWLSDIEKQGAGYDFWRVHFDYYHTLRSLGVDVDYISDEHNFNDYDIILVPSWPVVHSTLVDILSQCTAQVVFGPRCGAKTEEFCYPEELPPGELQRLLPFKVTSVDTMRADINSSFQWRSQNYHWHSWRDHVDAAQELVHAKTDAGAPILLNKERFYYITALTGLDFLKDFLCELCQQQNIQVFEFGEDVRVSQRGNLTFVFNYSANEKVIDVPDDAQVVLGQTTLPAHDVLIWKTGK